MKRSHIRVLAWRREDHLPVGLQVLEAWWRRGILQKDSDAYKVLVEELVTAGVQEAVLEYCEVARGEGHMRGLNRRVLPTLLETPSGRALIGDVLEKRIPCHPRWRFYLIALAAEQDEQLAQRALAHLLSLDVQPADDASYRLALSSVATKLDLFVFRGPDGRISCRPRSKAGA